ncbi:MAG: hypothetical protein A3G24_09450 [Betaproteobacteria bacterium RIFCSPLOWO2_12_FULL_62_13]|nr:MAG: hypothetical protein A3G24_09450 [Betaproteobacteria bacterium RIFCSPLOWO2_12_FULL_62_13]
MTNLTHGSTQRHREQPSAQRVITRHNALVFYGLAAASFLETAIPLHANALLDIFTDDQEVRRWIEQTWWPVKSAHARETRACVEAIWPEFDWSSAYGEFYEGYRPLVCAGRASRSPAHEALARSITAAQAAAFYRCLGTATDDPEVRRLLYGMSGDASAHFDCFRRIYERRGRGERLGLLATYRTIVTCARRARDIDVQLAFSRLNTPHWYGSAPFSELGYRDFVLRMGEVVRRHVPLGLAQRLLFRPWLQARRLPLAPVPASAARGGRALLPPQLQLGASPR